MTGLQQGLVLITEVTVLQVVIGVLGGITTYAAVAWWERRHDR